MGQHPPATVGPDHAACLGTASVMTGQELHERLAALPQWSLDDGQLRRQLSFASFAAAFAFVTRLALLAERRNHHPAIHLDKRELELRLWTRKMAALTVLDLELAQAIDDLVEESG